MGNQAAQRLLRDGGIQAKLTVNQPGDRFEQEADRVAETVMRMPDPGAGTPPSIQRMCTECEGEVNRSHSPSLSTIDESVVARQINLNDFAGSEPVEDTDEEAQPITAQRKSAQGAVSQPTQQPTPGSGLAQSIEMAGRSGGQPLPPDTRQFMESRFGHDFGQVRLHTDARSADAAWDLRARAYTVGPDIAFGTGQYAPETSTGRRLLAHELAHVVQQRHGAGLKIRMSHLRDFNDEDEKHDPAKLTDAEIEATDEFKAYMDSKLIWQWQLKVTREEALLASRLILRQMRDGKPVTWESQARGFALMARKQLGTLKETEKLVGKLEWVPSQESEFKNPAAAQSDFARFALAGGPEPTDTSKMNCFEMILFGAFRGGMVTKDRIQKIYAEAAKKSDMAVPVEVEKQLCRGSKRTFDPADPKSPEPLPGDIIIFDFIANHAAISRGTKDASGKHEVINLVGSNDPTLGTKVGKTTIETLLPLAGLSTVKFCTSSW
ncbi:MAG TPA: DUF4157 domain-containing protein [Verrucomicrobiae bacterium]|nr:DUF4157 domain-containing protein [Verrucomicrobiae bacterium]